MAEQPGSQGPSTDRNNEPVVDPTKNVLDLVEAAVDNLKDDQKAVRREMELRATYEEKIATLRAVHDKELRDAEGARIDAIRAVDVTAVASAASVAENRATALAAVVTSQAEAVRTGLAAALEPIQKDIADLRRAQYEAQGVKTQGADTRLNLGAVFGGLAALIALIALVVAILIAI